MNIEPTVEDRQLPSYWPIGVGGGATGLSNCKFFFGLPHLGSEFNQFAEVLFKRSGKHQRSGSKIVQRRIRGLVMHLHEPNGIV